MNPEHEALFHNLQKYLGEQYGQAVFITDAKPLSGGASRDSWHLSLRVGEGQRHLVLRRLRARAIARYSASRPRRRCARVGAMT